MFFLTLVDSFDSCRLHADKNLRVQSANMKKGNKILTHCPIDSHDPLLSDSFLPHYHNLLKFYFLPTATRYIMFYNHYYSPKQKYHV